jgi:hypothetical protein
MPGGFDEFINNSGQDILEAIGNLEDYIKIPRDYEEAMNDINREKQKQEKVRKYWDIANKINMIDYDSLPLTKKMETDVFNPSHPDFVMMDKSDNPAVQSYYQYITNLNETNEDGTLKYPEAKSIDFRTYLDMNPNLQQYITPQHYTKQTNEIALTPEEYEMNAYKSAGLTDDDIAFYKENKNSIDTISSWNQKVQNMIYSLAPGLKSKFGKRDLSGQLSVKGSQLLLPEQVQQKHKYGFKEVGDKMLKYDETTGNYKVIDIPGLKKKETTKEWEYFIDEDGSLTGEKGKVFWGERVQDESGKWKIEYKSDLNEQEMKEYQNEMDKMNKTGVYAPKGRTGRRRGSSRGVNFSSWKPEQFKNLTQEQIDNLSVGDLKELTGYKKYLSSDIKDYLSKKTSSISDEENEEGNYWEAIYSGAGDDNEKQSMRNVQNWIWDTVHQWKRSDLTEEQWRDEVYQENWSDLEFEIAKKILKDKFNVNI